MNALRFDGRLKLVDDAPMPRQEGEALVQVLQAGICNTDLEITRGYADFRGVLGHEFVGRVVESPEISLVGRRVVGEINIGCNSCELCRVGDSRHCVARTVLGIKDRDGAFAEYLSLPLRNLRAVPDSISNDAAVFVEPLAAALHILDQVDIDASSNVWVVGDGKLAQLIILVLATTGCRLSVVGRHEDKLALARRAGARCVSLPDGSADSLDPGGERPDLVIEASGSPSGLPLALALVRPRGVIVLKSTYHGDTPIAMFPTVVNEVTIVGSRCGRFDPAIHLLESGSIDITPLISARFTLQEGLPAFEKASDSKALKVFIDIAD